MTTPPRTFVWRPGTTSGDWSSGPSWSDGTVPGALDAALVRDARVSGVGAVASVDVSGVTLAGGFQFGGATASGGVTAQGGADIRIASTLSVAAGLTVDGGSCIEIGSNPVFWPSWVKVFADGTLSGAGTIAANTAVYGTVVADGMTLGGLLVGSGEVLVEHGGLTVGTVYAGPTIAFDDPAATLSIAAGASMGATIGGFATGDAIDLLGMSATSASWAGGTLVLRDASGGVLASLSLQGAYGTATFAVGSDGHGGSLVTVAPGQARALVRAGDGSWTDGSWRDGAILAYAPPTARDAVTVAGGALTGGGAAASATLTGSVTLASSFQFGAATASGPLAVQGEMRVGSTLTLAAGLTVAGDSCVEIGSGPVFWPSWVKVFADGTLSGAGTIAANTVVYGTVIADSLTLGGLLVGSGRVVIEDGGLTVGTVYAGPTLAFDTAAATLTIAGGSGMEATLAGFAAGDAIDLAGVAASSAGVSGGNLVVRDAGGGVLATLSLQNAAALAATPFAVRGDGAGGSLIAIAESGPRSLSWTGGSGLWASADRWRQGGASAGSAAGSLDTVAVAAASALILNGPGAAATATLSGDVTLSGSYRFGRASASGHLSALGELRIANTLTIAAGLTVDGGSCVEIGSNPVFWPSWVKVFADGTLSGAGVVAANTVVYGTVVADGMALSGLLVGSGRVLVEHGGLTVGTVYAGSTIAFDAPAATLTIAAGASMGATIAGFVAGDAIDLAGIAAASAAIAGGNLVVRNAAGSVVATLELQSATGFGTGFSVTADGTGGSVVRVGSAGSGGGTARSLVWNSGGSGLWGSASSWGGATAPGTLDAATISGGAAAAAVLGTGSAASLILQRAVLLDGAFQAGSADVGGTLTLTGAGTQLAVGRLGQAGAVAGSVVLVGGGTLAVSGGGALGGLAVSGGGEVRVGTSLTISAGITVDGSSCVEIGANPVVWPSWVKVFAGGTLSGAGAVAANTVVYGTIVADGMRFGGLLVGSGTVRIAAAGASVGTVYAGPTLDFDAAGAVLTLTAPGSMAATLAGFDAGNGIDIAGVAGATATLSGGTLTVRDAAGALVANLTLAGATVAGVTTVTDGLGGTLVLGASGNVVSASPGDAGARSLTWTGPSGGGWSSAANWTAGGPVSAAPGSLDAITVTSGATPMALTGGGASAAATLHRSVSLRGSYQVGRMTVDGTLAVAGTLAVGSLGQSGAATPSIVAVTGGTLADTGAADVGALSVAGGLVQVGTTLSVSAGITVDGSSCVEIGANPVFWPSWVKVFAGGTLSGGGQIAANTLIDGTVAASGMRFGGLVVGSGTLLVEAAGATVGTVYSGPTIAFDAPGAVLTLTAPSSMAGTIAGFAPGEAIDLAGIAGASATLSGSTLLLRDATGAALANLALRSPSAAAVMVVDDGLGGSLVLGLGAATAAGSAAGTGTARSLSWSGPSGGDWANPNNWGGTACPGTLDAVTVTGGQMPLVLTGSGSSASLTLRRNVLLQGSFHAGSANLDGTLGVGAGSLTLGSLGQSGAAAPSVIAVAAGTLGVSGTIDAGSLSASGGALVQAGSAMSVSNGLTVDGASCLTIGANPVIWPSWAKVFAGGTLTGGGTIAANTLVNGTIVSNGMRFTGLVVGSGTILVESAGATVGIVYSGPTIAFDAPNAILTVAAHVAMGGTITGFGAGDAIDVTGAIAGSAVYRASGPLDGTLSVMDFMGGLLGTYALHGNSATYSAAAFSVAPDGSGGSYVIETPASVLTGPAFQGHVH